MSTPSDSSSPANSERTELDRALSDVVEQANKALATQDRLRALLRANQAVAEQLDLPVVLQRIVEAALQLVDAEYGALGVIDPPRSGLEQFIYQGISSTQADAIGHLPQGHGLLGALIDDPRPIRLAYLAEDDRSIGFPRHHPPMDSFVGVPIRIRDEVFGNLYLTNNRDGSGFSSEDEQLLGSLAATAGFAIDNARLFEETQRRQRWSAVTAEITAALVSAEHSDAIALVAERVLEVAGAAHVRVVEPTSEHGRLLIRVARGAGAEIEGSLVSETGSLAAGVLEGKSPQLVNDAHQSVHSDLLPPGQSVGSVIAVPLVAGAEARGALLAVRASGDPRFTLADLEMIADFAGQATLAIELSDARAARQRILLIEDRARIARDLHDHVIQQLFASGLELQSVAGTLSSEAAADRIGAVIGNLDGVIAQIRTIIFALSPSGRRTDSFRHQVIDLAGDFEGGLERTPTVTFSGPVDLVMTDGLASDALAVIREALANIAKHSHATSASLRVAVESGFVKVEIQDDGVGIKEGGRRSGLANLEKRAVDRGGTFTLDAAPTGTLLSWHIPLDDEEVGPKTLP